MFSRSNFRNNLKLASFCTVYRIIPTKRLIVDSLQRKRCCSCCCRLTFELRDRRPPNGKRVSSMRVSTRRRNVHHITTSRSDGCDPETRTTRPILRRLPPPPLPRLPPCRSPEPDSARAISSALTYRGTYLPGSRSRNRVQNVRSRRPDRFETNSSPS